MAEFSKLIITNEGRTLVAKMMSGVGNINFTKISSSDNKYTLKELENLTALSKVKQTNLISKVTRTDKTSVKVETAFNNSQLTTGYYMRALGLYAVDPDEGEILFGVTIETTGNCYMPSYNGTTASGAYIQLITTVGNAENVSLKTDSAAVATIGDINELREQFDNKVDKISGKGLSTEDYTTAEKNKLAGIESGAQVNSITGVKGSAESLYRTGDVNITKSDIGLDNVENKSSATIRGELTKENVTTALGYTPPTTDTTYSTFVKSGTGAKSGLVPAPSTTAGTTKYLREDGTWAVPPGISEGVTSVFSTTADGLVPKSTAGTGLTHYLTPNGNWKYRHMPIVQGEDKTGTGWILIAQLTFVYGYNDMINIFEVVGRINHHARLYIRGNGAANLEDTACTGFWAEGIEVQDNEYVCQKDGASLKIYAKKRSTTDRISVVVAHISKPDWVTVTYPDTLTTSDPTGTLVYATVIDRVDSELSSTSTNPVQNKAIYAKFNELNEEIISQGINMSSHIASNSGAHENFQNQLANKVDKVSGKGLSTNDFTDAFMTKLNGLETGANKTIVDSAMSDTSTNPVQNKIVNARIKLTDDVVSNLSNSLQSAYSRITALEELTKTANVTFTQISDYVTWTSYSCKRQGNLVILSGTLKTKNSISSGSTVDIGTISTDYLSTAAVTVWAVSTDGYIHSMVKVETSGKITFSPRGSALAAGAFSTFLMSWIKS